MTKIKLTNVLSENEGQCSIKEEWPQSQDGMIVEAEIFDNGLAVVEFKQDSFMHIQRHEYEVVE